MCAYSQLKKKGIFGFSQICSHIHYTSVSVTCRLTVYGGSTLCFPRGARTVFFITVVSAVIFPITFPTDLQTQSIVTGELIRCTGG